VKQLTFSILMANYNNENFIEVAIKSVIAQTYPNWELIIVDDKSTDNSIEVISPFLKDSRIKLIKHKNNLGYGGTLKTAAEHASNQILGILDADDKLHEEALENVALAYEKFPNVGFIYTNMWICDSNLDNCKISKNIGPTVPEKTTIFKCRIHHFKTFTKEAYLKTKGFDPNQKRSVDKDIIYKLEEVTNFKYINKPLYYYRRHEQGISQGKNKYQARLYHYIAKCKAYKRRLNTDIPNLTLFDLYKEYLKLTFVKQIRILKYFLKRFGKISLFSFIKAKFRHYIDLMKKGIKKFIIRYFGN